MTTQRPRRPLLSLLSALVAASAASCGSDPAIERKTIPAATAPAPRLVLPKNGWSAEARTRHVLDRLAFGASPAELAAVEKDGLEGWILRQMRPEIVRDAAAEAKLARYPTLTLSIARLAEQYPRPAALARRNGISKDDPLAREKTRALVDPAMLPRHIGEELVAQKIVRAVESRRQLQEVLVDFWFNHFNVDLDKGADRWLLTSYERDAIRPHVFGTFRELLESTATHPAMLFYLDNWLSSREGFARGGRKGGLNENYARELLELHTLGVDGGYTQSDVREVARCFTGWSFVPPRGPAERTGRRAGEIGTFIFRPFAHDDGAKTVLGRPIARGGRGDGEAVLDLLARHPSTARFIAAKLCRKFVSENPSEALVQRVAETFRKSGGDLPSVYLAIFTSEEFFSDSARRSLTKTPFEMAISAVRALGGTVEDPTDLARRIEKMGERLYRCAPPTGYKETAEAWMSTDTLVARLNFALALASGRIAGVTAVALPVDVDTATSNVDRAADRFSRVFFGEPVRASTLEAIRRATASDPPPKSERDVRIENAKVAGLLLGSPDFQRQ